MSASRRGYHHNLLLHDHGGADIHNYLCPGDHTGNRPHHFYFFVDLDLFDHRAANDDLHRAGYDYVYNHHVAANDVHLDYHYPAPDDDHGGAVIDIHKHDSQPAAASTDDDDDYYDASRHHLHVHYDPDDYIDVNDDTTDDDDLGKHYFDVVTRDRVLNDDDQRAIHNLLHKHDDDHLSSR